MSTLKPLVPVQVSEKGDIIISREQVAGIGLHTGDQLLLLPIQPDQFLLVKVAVPEPISPEAVSQIMREAFQQAGYTTRDQIIQLTRDVKREMAQEW